MGGQSLFMHVKTILPMTDGWTVKKGKKIRKIPLTKTNTLVIIVNAAKRCGNFISFMNSEKYSRGRRGAPAKGVGRGNRREGSNPSFSALQILQFIIFETASDGMSGASLLIRGNCSAGK